MFQVTAPVGGQSGSTTPFGALYLDALNCCHVAFVILVSIGILASVTNVARHYIFIGAITTTGAAWVAGLLSLLSFGIILCVRYAGNLRLLFGLS